MFFDNIPQVNCLRLIGLRSLRYVVVCFLYLRTRAHAHAHARTRACEGDPRNNIPQHTASGSNTLKDMGLGCGMLPPRHTANIPQIAVCQFAAGGPVSARTVISAGAIPGRTPASPYQKARGCRAHCSDAAPRSHELGGALITDDRVAITRVGPGGLSHSTKESHHVEANHPSPVRAEGERHVLDAVLVDGGHRAGHVADLGARRRASRALTPYRKGTAAGGRGATISGHGRAPMARVTRLQPRRLGEAQDRKLPQGRARTETTFDARQQSAGGD